MATRLISLVAILVLAACLHVGIGSRVLKLKSDQNDDQVKLSCNLEFFDNVKAIKKLMILKGNSKIVKVKGKSKLKFHKGYSQRFKANGHIGNDVSSSYLSLTIHNLSEGDSGVYKCVIIYWDKSGERKKDTTNHQVHVSSEEKRKAVEKRKDVEILRRKPVEKYRAYMIAYRKKYCTNQLKITFPDLYVKYCVG